MRSGLYTFIMSERYKCHKKEEQVQNLIINFHLWLTTSLIHLHALRRPVLLVEETRVPGNTTDLPQVTDNL